MSVEAVQDRPTARPQALGQAPIAIEPARGIRFASAAFTGAVVELSATGLRVAHASPEARAVPPAASGEIADAELTEGGFAPIRLRRLTVTGLAQGAGGAVLSASSEDAATRASLWFARERVARGQAPGGERALLPSGALPRIPGRGQYTDASRLERLEWIRRETKTLLGALQTTRFNPERLTGNCENLVGAIEVPLGLAGPLLFNGQDARGLIYAPLATHEGALVASVGRGATAISRSGGVTTRVVGQRMFRAPLFVFRSVEGAFYFTRFIRDHLAEMRAETRLVSRHANLVSVEPVIVGNAVHTIFAYETGDAAGQNMTTACTWKACQWLLHRVKGVPDLGFEDFYVEGNLSGDKKVTLRNFSEGRGIRVVAECMLDRAVLAEVLKATPEGLVAFHNEGVHGALAGGMVGHSVNLANVMAAMFIATGQDAACVHEASVGQFKLALAQGGVRATFTLPNLIVGTVGGGTHLPGQRASLEILGCAGAGKVGRLAEIIAGFALALDISTTCAVFTGEFASAHERFGRNRPVRWLAAADLDAAFFQPSLREAAGDPSLVVKAVEPVEAKLGSSIVTELTARKVSKLVGLFPVRLSHEAASGASGTTDVLVKVKPLDEEVILMVQSMAALCGPALSTAHNRFRHMTGFAGCHVRELALYEQQDGRLRRHMPRIYRTLREDAREAFVVVMERLRDMALMDTADDPSGWTPEAIDAALRGAGEVHSVWLGREAELRQLPWIGAIPSSAAMTDMMELWEALAVHAHTEFPELIDAARLEAWQELVASIPEWWREVEAHPRTLIHGDFNPRNIALRKDPASEGGLRLCAYDWELATMHLPQRDAAELLSFVLGPQATLAQVERHMETHRRALEAASGQALDAAAWRRGFALALRDLIVNRFALYLMGHTFREYGFMERMIRTAWRLHALLEKA